MLSQSRLLGIVTWGLIVAAFLAFSAPAQACGNASAGNCCAAKAACGCCKPTGSIERDNAVVPAPMTILMGDIEASVTTLGQESRADCVCLSNEQQIPSKSSQFRMPTRRGHSAGMPRELMSAFAEQTRAPRTHAHFTSQSALGEFLSAPLRL
jgi:hypothetical protein